MSGYLDILRSELDRVGARIRELEAQSEAHAETRAHLAQKISQLEGELASGATDPQIIQETVSHLRIEDEQTAEAERLVDHHLKERKKQLSQLAEYLEMQQDSSIV